MSMMVPLINKFSQSSNSGPNYYAYNISDSTDLEFSSCESPTATSPQSIPKNAYSIVINAAPAASLTFMGSPVQEPAGAANFASNNVAALSNSVLEQKIGNNNINSMERMREMIFRMAMMQPVHIDPESVKPPKRKNVKISKDPQSVAARNRRERISERIRILQRLVPGGTKMDTASMLDEAAHYLKFLKNQLQSLEQLSNRPPPLNSSAAGNGIIPMTMATAAMSYSNLVKPWAQPAHMVGSIQMLS